MVVGALVLGRLFSLHVSAITTRDKPRRYSASAEQPPLTRPTCSVVESLVSVVYWFPFYYTFKFVFLLWLSLPAFRGADIVFRSFLQPTLSRYFVHGSPSSNLRAKADALNKDQ